jgi:hypothetical protein
MTVGDEPVIVVKILFPISVMIWWAKFRSLLSVV